jgi:hypothetical protein
MTAQEIITQAKTRYGFIGEKDLAIVAANMETRLTQCLVRCGRCRFLAPAQDVKFLIECVEKNGDYVRDVSLK